MRLSPFVPVVLVLALSFSPVASAKKAIPEIQKTGIVEFDPTFMKAKTIEDSLDTIHTTLKSANQDLATTLALPKNTSLADSLAELKKKANNKVKTTLEDGKWPKLSATDAVPSDVQAGIDAVNNLTAGLKTSWTTLVAMPDQTKALVKSAKAFPSQLNLDLITKNNLTMTDLPKVSKKLVNNLKAVKATPKRVKTVTSQTLNMGEQVLTAFPEK